MYDQVVSTNPELANRAKRRRVAGLKAVSLLLLWVLAVGLTGLMGLTSMGAPVHYLPFGVVWFGVTVFLAFVLGSSLERIGWRVYLFIPALALPVVLYYVIGRPIEVELLRDTLTPYPDTNPEFILHHGFRDLSVEVLWPVPIGTGLAVLYGFAYWFIRHIMETNQGVLRSFGAGVTLYLLTGLLLWLHSAAAWFIIRVVAQANPAQTQWLRLVDDIGPHGVFIHIFAWPGMVAVCCG